MFKKIMSALLSLSIFISLLVSCSSQEVVRSSKTYDDNYRNFYEIYVRSFCDSNGDKIGDLQGLISKMDYLHAKKGQDDSQSLGIDGVWLMPIFTSPSQHKYDVTDYYEIDPTYGTMEDFEQMIEEFHSRGIHVILDMVINHTSNEHPWFTQAVEALNNGEESKYIDYYTFTQEPELNEDGEVITGFRPVEGNQEGYYYEGRFDASMPDLNLDNPEVIRELKDIMKFWIDKGVDGYRLDACSSYFTNSQKKNIEFLNLVVDYCKSINPDFYVVGEIWSDAYVISQYYKSGIDSLFNFDCSFVGAYQGLYNNVAVDKKGSLLSKRVSAWNNIIRNANLNAIDAPFLSNHDTARSGTYLSASSDRKLAASLYMMLPGNCFTYYGEEIGMTEGWKNDSEKRLPIMWSAEENGMDIDPPTGSGYVGYPYYGVYEQLEQSDSLLNHYKKLINLKKQNPEIQRAQVVSPCDLGHYNISAYTCAYDESSVMIIHNLTGTAKEVDLTEAGYSDYNQVGGFVIADDYVEYEQRRATVKSYEYEIPEVKADALPVVYINGKLTLPPKTTVVLRYSKKANSTFVTTAPYVTPTDLVSDSDLVTPSDIDDASTILDPHLATIIKR